MNPYDEDAAAETMRQIEAGWEREVAKGNARIAELEKELAEWKAALTTHVVKCATCEGDGFMDVMVMVEPGSEREVYEDTPCAECGGTGRGHMVFLLADARKEGRDAETERLREVVEAARYVDRDWDLETTGMHPHPSHSSLFALRKAIRALAEKPK